MLLMLQIALLFTVLILPGCNLHFIYGDTGVILARHDQPWANQSTKARMTANVKWYVCGSLQDVTWHGADGYEVDALQLARGCDWYAHREFTPLDPIPSDSRHAAANPPARCGAESYLDTRTIVSISPPIVVIVPIPSDTPRACGGVEMHGPYAFVKLAWGSVTLPYGYFYGDRLPYHAVVRWYVAKGVKQAEIKEAEYIDETTRRLDYGSGAFLLTRVEDQWVVTPCADSAVQPTGTKQPSTNAAGPGMLPLHAGESCLQPL